MNLYRSLTGLLLIPVVFCSMSFAQAKDVPLTGDQIIDKHFLAIGGKEKLGTIKTRVASGNVKASGPIQSRFFLVSESPDRLAALFKTNTYDWILIYNATTFLSTPVQILQNNVLLPGKTSALENKFKEMYSSGVLFGDMSLYNVVLAGGSDLTVKAGKAKKLGERQTLPVELKRKKGESIKAYFDSETFMLVRLDFGTLELNDTRIILDNSAIKPTNIEFFQEFSDFREVDGIMLPFKLRHVTVPPISPNQRASAIDIVIDSYEHNLKIDPKLFQ